MVERIENKLNKGEIMKFNTLLPLADRVVVRRVEEETQTTSGIIIPDSAKEKPQKGEVKEFKHCLNSEHCQGFVGCAKDMYGRPISGYNVKEGLCFSCNHWEELYEKRLDKNVISIRVDGRHYQTCIGDINKPPSLYAGFGGRKFIVKMKELPVTKVWELGDISGEFYTCNMWSQGTVPEYFRDKLPDNAEFLNEVNETVVLDGSEFITAFDIK